MDGIKSEQLFKERDLILKNKIKNSRSVQSEAEAINLIAKLTSEVMNEVKGKVLSKTFIVKNGDRDYKINSIPLDLKDSLLNTSMIKSIIKSYNDTNNNSKIVGVAMSLYGMVGKVDMDKDDNPDLEKLMLEIHDITDKIKQTSNLEEVEALSDVRNDLVSDYMRLTGSTETVSVHYTKPRSIVMVSYDTIGDLNSGIVISNQPITFNNITDIEDSSIISSSSDSLTPISSSVYF